MEGRIKNGQSRDTDNIGDTRYMTKRRRKKIYNTENPKDEQHRSHKKRV